MTITPPPLNGLKTVEDQVAPRVASMLRHQRILASAGSGKTYQLTNRYLRLVHLGVEPQAILASTFTRAAAGEIRDRILLRLAEAVDDETRRRELAEALGEDVLSRQAVLDRLVTLARRIDRMQVRTLDSFFASIVRAFALELGLPPGAEVCSQEQDAVLRAEAIRRMLDENRPQQLIDLLRRLTQGAPQQAVTRTIEREVAALHELGRQCEACAWESIPAVGGKLSKPDLADAIAALREAPLPSHKRFVGEHHKCCRRAEARDWEEFLAKGLSAYISRGEISYFGVPIENALADAYDPVIRHARAVLIDHMRQQTLATHRLLQLFHEQYEALKRRHRVLTFSDLVHALNDPYVEAFLSEIHLRIDATIEHLLLDEFQDTSVAQWRALQPIVHELVSDETTGRTLFCVGDTKQSIYGWREAEPDILENLPNLLFGPQGSRTSSPTASGAQTEEPIEDLELAKSWRSAPQIMQVVNDVFADLTSNEAMEKHQEVAAAWDRAFRRHTTARADLTGHVELRTLPLVDGDRTDRLRVAAREAADLAASLHRRAPSRSIGILTRTNRAVSRILFELHRREVPASGRGGGPVTDIAPANVLLDLLHLAEHPDDTVAAFNIAHSPAAALFEIDGSFARPQEGRPQRASVARRVRRMLADHGYAATLGRWISALARDCEQREVRRLIAMQEMAVEFDAAPDGRIADFIQLVERRAVPEGAAAPVQVMTVHQSKGLEFDMVILPDLSAQLTGAGTPSLVFGREGVCGPVTQLCRYVSKDLRALLPDMQPLFDDHERRTVRESLCVLYVAMTRAKRGLSMLIDLPTKRDGTPSGTIRQTLAGVVQAALAESDAEPGSIVYRLGDDGWLDDVAAADQADAVARDADGPAVAAAIGRIELPAARERRRRGAPSAPSAHRAAANLRECLHPPNEASRDRGTAMHALFESVHWLDDADLDEAAMLTIVRRAVPRREAAWARQIVTAFREAIEKPAVRAALHRPRIAPRRTVTVHRELPYLAAADGSAQWGIIDRIVVESEMEGGEPRVISASIIDFKTDAVDEAGAHERAATYREQVAAYRAAAAAMFNLDASAVSATLLFITPGLCISCPG